MTSSSPPAGCTPSCTPRSSPTNRTRPDAPALRRIGYCRDDLRGIPTLRTMFDAIVFVKALVVGLSVAAPVGPIGLLTIKRTLHRGFRLGLATGLGAAVADATYGTVGALGVTWLIAALTTARPRRRRKSWRST